MMETARKARFEELYENEIRDNLKRTLKLDNIMEVPKINKIVVNVGVTGSISDSKLLQTVEQAVNKITGQASVRTKAKKSIAGFKLREDLPIGVMVTLRRTNMYEFLDKLINLALPKVRDFQGVTTRFDGRGNYNLGIKEWIIFPELDQGFNEKVFGMNVTIHTSAKTDEHGFELLKGFKMPFRVKKS
jgi:large subunit ribosomal protein L5